MRPAPAILEGGIPSYLAFSAQIKIFVFFVAQKI
jgi:hypothetical protein